MMLQLDNFLVHPAKWYEDLKDKAVTLLSNLDNAKINDILKKIKLYAHMDYKTVQFVKAKLCLLMMSLPAYTICQIYLQQALKYIFEVILLGQEMQFEEWLDHRNICYVVVNNTIQN